MILQLPHKGVGQVSRISGAQENNVCWQDLGVYPEGKSGIQKGKRMPRGEYRVSKG